MLRTSQSNKVVELLNLILPGESAFVTFPIFTSPFVHQRIHSAIGEFRRFVVDVVDVDVGGAPFLGLFEVVGWGVGIEKTAAVGLHNVFLFVFI